VGRIPFVTLHDAIYGRIQDVPLIHDTFLETFSELGLDKLMRVKSESDDPATPATIRSCVSELPVQLAA
jgi:hypothetical protein